MKYVWLLFMVLMLTACNVGRSLAAGGADIKAAANIQIHLGKPIKELLDNSPLPFKEDCLAPVGMCWYDISKRFAEPDLPAVSVSRDGTVLLKLSDVGRISTMVEEAQGRHVDQVTLGIRGLPDNSTHAEQKAFVYQLLGTLVSSGWTHFYRFPAARIPGSEAHKIATADQVLRKRVLGHPWFDPRYEATLEQWLGSGGTYHWYFYQDQTYLQVTVQRGMSRGEPALRGTYLISLKLQTENAYWSQHFSEEDQGDWRKLLPALLEQYAQQRAKLEREAEAAGIKIEGSYRDPAIKLLGQ